MTKYLHLSTGKLALYALPAVPLAALQLPFFIVLPTYYAETVGLGLGSVGMVVLVVLLFDAVNDPAVGYLADRLRVNFGRRRLFVLIFSPIAAVAAWKVMTPAADATAAYFAIWSVVLSIGWSGVLIPLAARGAELADDYAGRTRIAAAREIATVIGTLIAVATPVALLAAGFADQATSLAVLAAIIAVLLPIFSWIAIAGVPEPPDRSRTLLTMRDGLRFLAANRPFRRLITAYLVSGLANGLPATLFILFVNVKLGWDGAEGPLLLLYFLCGILGVPLWLWLSRRLGKHRAWAVAMAVACIAFASVPFLGPETRYIYVGIVVVTGITLAADLTLPTSIQADVIDVDTAASGEQRSGIYFAAWGLAAKLSLAVAAGVGFIVLDFVGLDPAFESQPDGALLTLGLLYAGVPVVFKAIAIATMWRFPLDETAQIELRLRIDEPIRSHRRPNCWVECNRYIET